MHRYSRKGSLSMVVMMLVAASALPWMPASAESVDSIRISAYIDPPDVKWAGEMSVKGNVSLFHEGVVVCPANGSSVDVLVRETATTGHALADEDGHYEVPMTAPALAGDYTIEIEAMSNNGTYRASTVLHLRIDVPLDLMLLYGDDEIRPGGELGISGAVHIVNDIPVPGAMVIIEALGTTYKSVTYTDGDGEFDAEFRVTDVPGRYEVRVTAVSGSAVVFDSFNITVSEDAPDDDGGWWKVGGVSVTYFVAMFVLGLFAVAMMLRKRG